jgi:carbonic anhydrase
MDARIDVLDVLDLRVGDAHVLRNAGGRVTDDVLRGVSLSATSFGVTTIVVMQHTTCGAGISDHLAALCDDVDRLVAAPDLDSVDLVVGLLHDVESGATTELIRCERPIGSSRDHPEATSTKHDFATLGR